MTRNVYFSHGTKNEQYLLEDLIIESISIFGQEFYYIPRTLVSKDEILGEDRLSKFKDAFPIDMYLESVDGFEGQGAFIQKFGLMMEQSATLTVARRSWERFVGKYGKTIVPSRPNEGDLLYFPLTGGLFEIKFVDHQDPFYQLKKLYVYRLQIELFQYSSEKIETGIDKIDEFESLKTFSTDTSINKSGRIKAITLSNKGSNYTQPPTVVIESDTGRGAEAVAILGTVGTVEEGTILKIKVIKGGSGYETPPTITIVGDGNGAVASAQIQIDIDKIDSFGDNNKFKEEADRYVLFDEDNPFGDFTEVDYLKTMDSEKYTMDSTIITMDNEDN